MKKTIVFIVVAVFTTAVGAAYGQSTADEAFSPRVREKEKRLLQKLTPDQMQVIAQNAALTSFGWMANLGEFACIFTAILSMPAFLLLIERRRAEKKG